MPILGPTNCRRKSWLQFRLRQKSWPFLSSEELIDPAKAVARVIAEGRVRTYDMSGGEGGKDSTATWLRPSPTTPVHNLAWQMFVANGST
jgi:hypothetical protein